MVCPHCGDDEYNKVTRTEDGEEVTSYECSYKFCKEYFDEPIEDYEFNEQMKERIAEDKADEARDMGN